MKLPKWWGATTIIACFLTMTGVVPAQGAFDPQCSTTDSTKEPILDEECVFFPFAMGYSTFDTCSYSSYGIEIAKSRDGIYRIEVETANGLGYQGQPQVRVSVQVQEDCNHTYGRGPAYLLEANLLADDGSVTKLGLESSRSDYKSSNVALLPYYCGFWACGDSYFVFTGTLPTPGTYTLQFLAAWADTGLADGLQNSIAHYFDVINYEPFSLTPSDLGWSLGWDKSPQGYKCQLRMTNTDAGYLQGMRQANLITTVGTSVGIQNSLTSFGIEWTDPTKQPALPKSGTIKHQLGTHDFSVEEGLSAVTDLHQMSHLLVYVCKGWITTAAGSTEIKSAIMTPPESFAPEVKRLWYKNHWLPKFSRSTTSLTSAQKSAIKARVEAYPDATKFICTGIVNAGVSDARNMLIRKRAKAACEYAKSLNPDLSTWYQRKFSKAISYEGSVLLTIKGEE